MSDTTSSEAEARDQWARAQWLNDNGAPKGMVLMHIDEVSVIKAALAALTKERDELKVENAKLKPKGFVCCWCGHKSIYHDGDDPLELMAEHAALCQKTPLFNVLTERDTLKAEVARLKAENADVRAVASFFVREPEGLDVQTAIRRQAVVIGDIRAEVARLRECLRLETEAHVNERSDLRARLMASEKENEKYKACIDGEGHWHGRYVELKKESGALIESICSGIHEALGSPKGCEHHGDLAEEITAMRERLAALERVMDAAEEINDILGDSDSRSEIDSFTRQPLNNALIAAREVKP